MRFSGDPASTITSFDARRLTAGGESTDADDEDERYQLENSLVPGDFGIDDVPIVGGKNASPGAMYRELVPRGIALPEDFAVTDAASFDSLERTGTDH